MKNKDNKYKSRRSFVKEIMLLGGGVVVSSSPASSFYSDLIQTVSKERINQDEGQWDALMQRKDFDTNLESVRRQKIEGTYIAGRVAKDPCGDAKCDGGCDGSGFGYRCYEVKK